MAICSASYNIAGYLLALLEKTNPFLMLSNLKKVSTEYKLFYHFVLKMLTNVQQFSCGESVEGGKKICSHLKPYKFISFYKVFIPDINGHINYLV